MKATIEIPDALYRRVKARSASEGLTVRAVVAELFRSWLDTPSIIASHKKQDTRINRTPWLAITRPHLRLGMSHDLHEIRSAIAEGWSADSGESAPSAKISTPPRKRS